MPKYFFTVNDGLDLPDEEGVELPDLEAALRAAVHYAGSLLKEEGHRIRPGDHWSVEVAEEAQPSAFRIDLRINRPLASAVQRRRSAA